MVKLQEAISVQLLAPGFIPVNGKPGAIVHQAEA
jgi:hypothetical protein